MAVKSGHVKVVQLLLDSKADINKADAVTAHTLLPLRHRTRDTCGKEWSSVFFIQNL